MRHLQSYDDAEQARGLSDQLEVEGIENQVRSDDGRHSVWIINEEELQAASELAGRYPGGPSDTSRAEAERIRKQREADARPVRIPGLSHGTGRAGGGPVGPATLTLIGPASSGGPEFRSRQLRIASCLGGNPTRQV